MPRAKPVVVDTSAWIEFLIGSPLGQELAGQFPDKGRCVVPTLVQLELYKWLLREADEDKADEVMAYTQECVIVPLDTTIALQAAQMHREHRLATADAIVYATAQAEGASLLTCDAHFADLPGVSYWPKRKTH